MRNIFPVFLFMAGLGLLQKGFSQSSDTLQLKNGQSLVGIFLGWHNNDISFSIHDAGLVTVNYKKISILQGNSSNYRIETATRKVFYGKLSCINPGEFVFVENGKAVSVSFKNMHNITPYKKGGTVAGYIGIGYNYAQSNDFGLFTVDGGFTNNSKRWIIEGSAMSTIVHTKSNGMERNRDYVSVKTHRIINPIWQFGTRYIHQRNKELGLAYRHLLGGGFEFNAIKKPNFLMNLASGISGALEGTFDNQRYSRFEIPFLLEVKVYNLGGSNLSLNHTQTLFISAGSNRRIRHDGDLRLNMKLVKKLSLTTYLYDNYDSSPLQKTGTTNLDFGWNTGLKFSF